MTNDPGQLPAVAARAALSGHPLDAARALLGATFSAGPITARIVEVEAYGSPADGPWPDPAAHTYPGVTGRNAVMFGPAGHLYVYLSYGIHVCANITAGPEDVGSGVLLRAGEITSGVDAARRNRGDVTHPTARLAAGPGRFGQALGVSLHDKGIDVLSSSSPFRVDLVDPAPAEVMSGPRIGISKAADYPWRLWLPSPALSK